MEWMIFIVLGVCAGFFSGLLGVGGGTVVVPTLYFLFKYYLHLPQSLIMHVAIGTSIAVVMINAFISTIAHARKNNVLWSVFRNMLLGLILGAVLASVTINFISGRFLHILFVIFIFISAVEAYFDFKPVQTNKPPSQFVTNLAGLFIGFFSSLLGIGGSVISLPYFLWSDIKMKQAVALASACGFPLSFVATIGFVIAGYGKLHLPQLSFGYVFLPSVITMALGAIVGSPAGAAVSRMLPEKLLRMVFVGFLVVVAVIMLIEYLY